MTDNVQARDASGAALFFRTNEISTDLHVPVHRLDDLSSTGPAALSLINVDLLTGDVNGWFNVSAFASAVIQIVASAGISAGAIIFEQTNDPSSTVGTPIEADEIGVLTSNPAVAAVTISASTRRMWALSIGALYIRVRISTAFVGGTVQAFSHFSSVVFASPVINVQQAVASSLSTTMTPVAAAAHTLVAAASTNLTSVKTSAGQIYALTLTNMSGGIRYLKLYNKASAPVSASDVPVFTIPIAATSMLVLEFGTLGLRFTTGIAYAMTAGLADTDATALSAGDLKLMLSYL